MDDRLKRALGITAFALSTIGIGTALYFTFFRAAPSPVAVEPPTDQLPSAGGGTLKPSMGAGERPVSTGSATGTGLRPAAAVANGGLTQTTSLTSGAVAQTSLSKDGNGVNYYDATDGRFYKVDGEGNVVRLSDKTFPQVQQATWDAGADKAVLEFPDGSNVVYDFENETQVTLPSHWKDFDFSPTGGQIIAKSIAVDPANRWLVTVNADGSNARAFQALGDNESKVQVAWSPNDQVVAFSDTGESQGAVDRRMIIPLGKNQENLKGLVVEGYGFLPNWSPDGSRLLYSAAGDYSDSKPLLWTVDGAANTIGANRRSLGLNTWADKCSFASATILYCAVPRDLPSNAGLQRSLYRNLPDTLYQADLSTGRTSLVAVPAADTTMERLQVSADGTEVFYTNASTGQLERLKLK